MFSLNGPARSSRRLVTSITVPLLALAAVTACNPLEPVQAPTAPVKPTAPVSSGTGVQAKPADALVNAYGVNVHMVYGGTPYMNVEATGNALNQLGARHVRDRIHNNPAQWATINKLSARGIRFNLIVGAPNDSSTPAQLVNIVASKVPGATATLEGANEWNLKRRPNWVAELRAHQTALWKAAKANPTTARMPVLSPSLGSKQDFSALGNISGLSNYGNIHNYPGGRLPSTDIATTMASARINSGNQPIMTTETQYQNALRTSSGHKPTSEKAAGVYAPRLLLENYSRGVARMFNYELFDQKVDPAKADIEMNFGLIRTDGTRKPAFNAMSNLLNLLADPGAGFQPGRLDYKVANAPADLKQMLVQKRDGRFYLVLWRDVRVWDQVARKDVPVQPHNVTVNLGRSAKVATFLPSTQRAATRTLPATRSITVPMAGQTTVLQVG